MHSPYLAMSVTVARRFVVLRHAYAYIKIQPLLLMICDDEDVANKTI